MGGGRWAGVEVYVEARVEAEVDADIGIGMEVKLQLNFKFGFEISGFCSPTLPGVVSRGYVLIRLQHISYRIFVGV